MHTLKNKENITNSNNKNSTEQKEKSYNAFFNQFLKVWAVKPTLENLQLIESSGLIKIPEDVWSKVEYNLKKYNTDLNAPIEVPGLLKELFSFQKKAVAQINELNGRAILADEMGLGKTAESLAFLRLRESKFNLIICPNIMLETWKREIKNWLGHNVVILNSSKLNKYFNKEKTDNINLKDIIKEIDLQLAEQFSKNDGYNYIVCSYDIIWRKNIRKYLFNSRFSKFTSVIIDEFHLIKNKNAKRTKGSIDIINYVNPKYVIGLSGTPFVNNPEEIFIMFHLINPTEFNNIEEFKRIINKLLTRNKLFSYFKGKGVIRRRKEEVISDLPDKTYNYLNIANNFDFLKYEKLKQDLIEIAKKVEDQKLQGKKILLNKIKSESGVSFQRAFMELRMMFAINKVPVMSDFAYNVINEDKKIVIFTNFNKEIDFFITHFKKKNVEYAILRGRISNQQKTMELDKFIIEDKCKIMLANIRCANAGITLTVADTCIINSFPLTSVELEQAIARLHRIGQKNNVNIYLPYVENTIEEQINERLILKQQMLDKVIDGKDIDYDKKEIYLKDILIDILLGK